MTAAAKASTRSAARSLRITSPPMFLLLQLTEGCGACVPHILWRYVPKIFQPTGHVVCHLVGASADTPLRNN